MNLLRSLSTITLCLWIPLNIRAEKVVYQENFSGGAGKWHAVGKIKPQIDANRIPGRNAVKLMGRISYSSPKISLQPSQRYKLTFDSWAQRYGDFHSQIESYDVNGRLLSNERSAHTNDSLWEPRKNKRRFNMPVYVHFDTSGETAYVKIRFNKYADSPDRINWISNIKIIQLDKRELLAKPTLDPQGKPYSTDSLMLPGPDGFLYPNWTQAGLQELPPEKMPEYNLEKFGGLPDDGKDDSAALEQAISAAEKSGGGFIKFKAGKYYVSRKFYITSNNTILQGAGKGKTVLEFGLPDNKLSVLFSGTRMNKRGKLEAFFPNAGAEKATVFLNDKVVAQFTPEKFIKLPDAKDFTKIEFSCKAMKSFPPEGIHRFKVKVDYKKDKAKVTTITFEQNNQVIDVTGSAVINFLGKQPSKVIYLAGGVKRGSRKIKLGETGGLKAGDYVRVKVRQSKSRNKLTLNECSWGDFRTFLTKIASISGKELTLAQPLRIDLPAEDKPYIIVTDPMSCSGIKNMTLKQTGNIQIEMKLETVNFTNAVNCFAENLRVERPGTRAVYFCHAKWSVLKDCEFTAPWRTKIGGLSYVGFDSSWDCLIERIKSEKMRHGPAFNWSCSGNVVRECSFFESDAQWHSGWCRDNLLEQSSIITNSFEYGSYGWAFFSTPTDDAMHGSNGPRNVIYNCYSESSIGTLYMGGFNRRWMVMYNTMVTKKGPGILQRLGCGDNIIAGNVFVLKSPEVPMIYNEFLDNTGDMVENNTIYGGNGKLFAGPGKPAIVKNNRFYPLSSQTTTAKPPVPSIYKWQLEKYGKQY